MRLQGASRRSELRVQFCCCDRLILLGFPLCTQTMRIPEAVKSHLSWTSDDFVMFHPFFLIVTADARGPVCLFLSLWDEPRSI